MLAAIGCASERGDLGDATDSDSANLAPIAQPDVLFALANTRLRVPRDEGLLRNDVDPNGDALRIVGAGGTTDKGGLVGLGARGAVDLAPAADLWGKDRFVYAAEDPEGGASDSEVTVHVSPSQHTIDPDTLGDRGFSLFTSRTAPPNTRDAQAVAVGDVDGDGTTDLLITDNRIADGGVPQGRAYVVYGGVVSGSMELADMQPGTEGFVIDPAEGGRCCANVRAAGDVNGDGLADVMLGESVDRLGSSDRVFVVFGTRDKPTRLSLDAIAAGEGGFVVDAENAPGAVLLDYNAAGDFNSDGKDDLVFVAPLLPVAENVSGRVYVVWGSDEGTRVQLSDVVAGEGGAAMDASEEGGSITAAGSAGDFNGDGAGDLLLGGARSYVLFGGPDRRGLRLPGSGSAAGLFFEELVPALSFPYAQPMSHGDINGDGIADLTLTRRIDGEALFVVFGSTQAPETDLDKLRQGVGGFEIALPDGPSLELRTNTAWSPDLNGDDLDDLVITIFPPPGDKTAQQLYAVYGSAQPERVRPRDLVGGVRAFELRPLFGTYASAQGVGDINGDGVGDLLFGPHHSPERRTRVDIIYGTPTGDTCCVGHRLPGCTDGVVQACVCETDDACCTTAWTSDCAELAGACQGC